MPDQQTEPFIFTALAQRFFPVLAVFIFVPLLYLELTTAYVSTQEAIKAHAVADNAAVKQHAEAVVLRAQAKITIETARNAVPRVKAEAEATEAEADKIAAEAQTLKEKAENADRKARGEATETVNKARLRRAELIAGNAELQNVARKEKAEVERLEGQTIDYWSYVRRN